VTHTHTLGIASALRISCASESVQQRRARTRPTGSCPSNYEFDLNIASEMISRPVVVQLTVCLYVAHANERLVCMPLA